VSGERTSSEDLAHAIQLMHASSAIADTFERARQYRSRALDALAPFPTGKAKAALSEAVEFAVARAY
jgi:octaprenyl-diphosphate synthase